MQPSASSVARRRLEHGRHLGVDRQAAQVAAPGDPQPASGRSQVRDGERLRDRERIARVRAGERREQQRDVARRARDRPEHRQRVPRVARPGVRDPAGGGAQADEVAERGGVADARAEVGPVGERHHPGRDGGRRAAAGAAGRAREVVRVARRAEDRVEGLRARAELGRVRLADHDRARRAQALDDQRVVLRDVLGEQRRAVRRPHPGRVLEVLDRDRQPVQDAARSEAASAASAACSASSGSSSVTIALTRGLTAAIRSQMRLHHLARGELTGAEARGELRRGAAPHAAGLY